MWNKKRSIILSKVFVVAFMVGLAACLIGGPWLVDWVYSKSPRAQEWQEPLFYATLYTGGVLLALLLWQLMAVLVRVGRGVVFDRRNVSGLRFVSWVCFIGALLCGLSAIYYLPWLIVFVVAAFVGLVVRIVKNILAEAIHIKEENDYTI